MHSIAKVLLRTLVSEFYRANAGFFLVVMGLGFGFLKIPQHVDIASGLAAKPVYYLIPLLLWSLYGVKTLLFCTRIRKLAANQIIGEIVLLQPIQRKLLVVYVQTLLLLPALVYGLFMSFTAFQLGALQSAGLVLLGNGFILFTAAHFLHQVLISPSDPKATKGLTFWTQKLPKSFSWLYIHHLFNRQPIVLLASKAISVSIILGATYLYKSDENDLRLLTLGVLLSSAVNSVFSYRHFEFEASQLTIFRNLPLSLGSRFTSAFLTYLVLMSPELLVLVGNNLMQSDILFLVKISMLAPVLLLLYQSILTARKMDMEYFIRYPFFLTAILFFVILGEVDPAVLTATLIFVSALLFFKLPGFKNRGSQA